MNVPSINNNSAPTKASSMSAATTSVGTTSSNSKNTTRVYLRVKRRRCPSPTQTTTSFSNNANSINNGSNKNNNKGPNTDNSVSGPDRIQIALPYISTTTHGTTANKSNNKRRKISDREERALIDRLDSAVSLHDTTANTTANNTNTNNNASSLFNTPARRRSLQSGVGNNNPYDPITTQHSQSVQHSHTNEMQHQQRDRSASFASNTNTANNNTSNKETPAPPIKPKRTITFRKIHNLQKRLLSIGCNNSSSEGQQQKIRIVDVTEQRSDEGGDSSVDEKINVDNINMDNNKVGGKEPTPKTDNTNTIMGQQQTTTNMTMMMGQSITNTPSIATMKGSGQRVNRMRPRPSSTAEEEEEKKSDDVNNEDGNGDQGEGGGRQKKKRRKVCSKWIVEQSRTVLESDLIMEGVGGGAMNNNGLSLFGGCSNTNNLNMADNDNINNNKNNSHPHNQQLPLSTIRLIEYSLRTIHNQNYGKSVTPHLTFLQYDPRLCGMGYLYVDFALGSSFVDDNVEEVDGAYFVGVGDGGVSSAGWTNNGGMDLEGDMNNTSHGNMNNTTTNNTDTQHKDDNGKGRTILHMAALYGDISAVRTLLNEMHATPNLHDGNGNTPSMLARIGLDRLSNDDGMMNQADLLARRGTYNVIEALIEGKVQSMMTQKNNSSSSLMAATTTTPTTTNAKSLDVENKRLIESSLTSLLQQQHNNNHSDESGGSVSSHISLLKNDPRLNNKDCSQIINHALSSHQGENAGRTALHLAALYGDFTGVRTLLNMGSNPTLVDGLGNTPAMLGRYMAVVDLLVEGEKKWRNKEEESVKTTMNDDTNPISGNRKKKDGNDNDEEYYYEVYCLEETTAIDGGGKESGDTTKSSSSSNFLRSKDATAVDVADSIPGLELSSVLSEDDTATYSSGGMNKQQASQQCALIELQQGFGYWNERGELILEADSTNRQQQRGSGDGGGTAGDENDARFVQKFYHNNGGDGDDDSIMAGNGDEDEHDSNDEGYDGNDYPEDDISFGLGDPNDSDYDDYRDADAAYGYGCDNNSDDEDDESLNNDWRLDFRNRYVSKDALNQFNVGGEEGEDDETGY